MEEISEGKHGSQWFSRYGESKLSPHRFTSLEELGLYYRKNQKLPNESGQGSSIIHFYPGKTARWGKEFGKQVVIAYER